MLWLVCKELGYALEITMQCISMHTLTLITMPIQLLFTSEIIRVLTQDTVTIAHDIHTYCLKTYL